MVAENHTPGNSDKLKEIPKWTRRYAQNRTLTILVLMLIITLFSMFVALLVAFLLGLAFGGFQKGNILLGCAGIVVLIAVVAAIVKFYVFMFAKFGGKNKGLLDQIVDRWIYNREGTASMPMPEAAKKTKWSEFIISIVYMVCLLGSMNLAMRGYISDKYFIPLTALFVVPFNVYLYFIQRPRLGPVLLLCPILYTIHAILIMAGVPIYFTGIYAVPLNLLLPLIYTFITYLIGHLYSRHALKKLKSLTHLEGETANGD
jgi:ABC-type multidrug transport system fused ATPase/permease subunit